MKMVTLYLPPAYIKTLDELVDDGFYPCRAEAIRFAVRDLLTAHKKFGNTVHLQPRIDYKPPSPQKILAIEHAIQRTQRRAPRKKVG